MIINLVKNMRRAVEHEEGSTAHRILLFEAIREIVRLQKKVVNAEKFSIQNIPINPINPIRRRTPLSLVWPSAPIVKWAKRVMP